MGFAFACTFVLPAVAHAEPPHGPDIGREAPDFPFLSQDGRWKFLHDLRGEGPVLLVFEPSEARLAFLDREADSLRRAGVTPLAVYRRAESSNWSAIERLGLTIGLLSDPRGDLASGFLGAAANDPPRPAWFLVDRDGRVCARDAGALPEAGLAGILGDALGTRNPASALRP